MNPRLKRTKEERERESEKKLKKKRKEYYETHMKKETERLNTLVDWYKLKLNEIREAPVDDRPRMLERLYRISKKNKCLGVTITRAVVINWINYPGYPPKLKLHEYEDNDKENVFYDTSKPGSLPAACKPYS